MRIKKFVATSILAIAATGIAAAVADAEPAAPASPLSGTDQGVGYTTSLADNQQGVTTRLTGGSFSVSDGQLVVKNSDGVVIEHAPLAYQVAGRSVSLEPQVSADGGTLTLGTPDWNTPVDNATFDKGMRDVVMPQVRANLPGEQQVGLLGASAGAIIGVAVGAAVGFAVGLPFLVFGAIPGMFIGGAVGAAIGAVVGAVVL
ncbi:hypothetical protein IU500_32345 [Nocardia terpenica]|uniref:hypothetical protein n=1 Tax=Nocardia terpenica TaxID=455432 RepID=UPI0018950E3E|nr:hypothetical protein [Nocardia terpenica]MBF6065489.1 hypothetical protein [Nocardia terpenica]MBF6108709.1 hypothetical protein [Nocardia terpenica]MBF6115739.1 hypothetical protein [Nocardia terpenica]MBF6122734.1 hypothetical protein [Nocardia terpenica]MBF6155914.1 hypothetical protein [Nocardia terpenica]